MIEVQETASGVKFCLRVQPRAGRTEICGEWRGALRVRLAAPPVDNRANDAVLRLVAARLKVPLGAVTLLRGERSRTKQIEVRGVTAERVRALVSADPG